MSEWVDIPLTVAMGEDDSTYVSDIELTNLMLKENPPGSRKPFHISSVPTLKTPDVAVAEGSGAIRGMCVDRTGGSLVTVQGTVIWNGAVPGVGSMPGTAPCRMVFTGTHTVIVDGTNARCIVAGSDAVVTPSIEGFVDVTYQDGYTIYADALSQRVYVSALDDPTTIGALDFTTVDAHPGHVVGLASVNRELLVIKNETIEYYYNGGGAGFPFVRSSPGVAECGSWPQTASSLTLLLKGVNAIQEHRGVVYFVGRDQRIYAVQGYQVRAISTPWVNLWLRTNHGSETLFGSAFTFDGRSYYILSGITEGSTEMALVYDIDNALWHKRYSSISSVLQITSAVQSAAGDQVVIAAKNTGTGNSQVYALDPSGTNDVGAAGQVNRVMTLPQLNYGDTRAFMPELLMDMQKPATTGTITLTWSDNGGTSYTSGVTNTGANPRTRWQRLGSFYQRILRITFSIASKISIMGVRARIEVGE